VSAAPPGAAPLPSAAASGADVREDPVWLCLWFPALALQAVQHWCVEDRPNAVCDPDQGHLIVAPDAAARRAGIRRGHGHGMALALCAELNLVERRPEREAALLAALGRWATQFTSFVSCEPPQALLLEVRGSLRLFGGIDALRALLDSELASQGYRFRQSCAPTPLGALWLVRAGQSCDPLVVVDEGCGSRDFQRALSGLDIAVTGWAEPVLRMLRESGVHSLGDCRRLPRGGLSRRSGREVMSSLDRAFGDLPDVRRRVIEAEGFSQTLELDAEIRDAMQLESACMRLLDALEVSLRRQQRAARRLVFVFHPWRGEATRLELRSSAAGYRRAHWSRLLTARLEHCELAHPAVAVSLEAHRPEPAQIAAGHLPLASPGAGAAHTGHREDESRALLDRLDARLGSNAVRSLTHVAEYRPEYASQEAPPRYAGQHCAALPCTWRLSEVPPGVEKIRERCGLLLQRPLWILDEPVALTRHGGVLWHEGELALVGGPERIESGWWDEHGSVRDYFVAVSPAGARLWVFRERAPASGGSTAGDTDWWLHGVFG
jgi:protein ImuB